MPSRPWPRCGAFVLSCSRERRSPNSIELSKAQNHRDQQDHRRPHPDQQENRLVVLDDAIDRPKRPKKLPVAKSRDRPGMTTTANANKNPATSEQSRVATNRVI